MTRVASSSRLRTSHLRVWSLRSGRIVPHPKYCWISVSTSLRSPFWLTDTLGRTSHPTRSVGRGPIETVKHPSPSTYPEMYDGRSVASRASREPASCVSRRFATLEPYGTGVTVTGASPRRDQSLRGHTLDESRGLPTALPAVYRLVLEPRQPVWASPL